MPSLKSNASTSFVFASDSRESTIIIGTFENVALNSTISFFAVAAIADLIASLLSFTFTFCSQIFDAFGGWDFLPPLVPGVNAPTKLI